MNDEDLVKAAQKGDVEAFYKLIVAYKDKLYNTSYCYLKSEQDTLEAIQEVTCRAYLKINKLKDSKYFNTWLTRIMINYCIDEQKRKKKVIYIQQQQAENNNNDMDNFCIDDALEKLQPKYKEVIILKYIKDMTIIDISKVMECPEGTVKTWISRGLKQLKDLLNVGGNFNV